MAVTAARLPIPPTALIGREGEIARVRELLGESRLVTLTGPGGTGKTRLALEVLAGLECAYPDGAAFVDLAPLADPLLVPSAIAQALDVKEQGGRPVEETLLAFLARRELLLCLDNFEHLLAAGPVVSRLLAAAPGLAVLATSRAPLRLAGEREHQVPPLEPGEAQELFTVRARQAKDGFVLTDENRAAVAEICQSLDRLPLAIELAAARIRALPPEKLRERLGERLPLLTQGARDAPARQQTLRATIGWSYGLLGTEQQALLARLSVFAGGCTLEACEVVCDGSLDTLASLVEQSLIREEDIGGEPRYTLLETVREYALEQLQERREEEKYRRRHLAYFLALAEEAEPALFGSAQLPWLDRLELELDNLRAALSVALDSGMAEGSERLAAAFSSALVETSRLRESGRWLEAALALDGDVAPGVRAATLRVLGYVTFRHGEFPRARALLEEAARLLRVLGDDGRLARTLGLLLWVTQQSGDRDAVARLVDEIEPLLPRLRAPSHRCEVRIYLGWVHTETGDHDRARALFGEAGRIAREHGDRATASDALNAIGWLAMLEGDYERARLVKEEALAIARDARHPFAIALALGGLGVLFALQGDLARAAVVLAENLRLISERGDARLAAESLVVASARAAASREALAAARLAGAGESLYEQMGGEWNPLERLLLERHVWPERGRLGEAFEEAWAEGRRLSFDEAIDYALDSLDGAPAQPAPPPLPALELEPGAVVGGFEVEELVGRGGMGVVYRARQRSLDRTVALKVLSPALAADEDFRARFLREALASLVARDGGLPAERALAIVAQVAAALDAAHAKGLRLAAAIEADQYSLACVLFECLAGEPPFPRETEAQLLWAQMQEQPPSLAEKRPELPGTLADVVAKALAKEPAERFASAGELARAASAALEQRHAVRPLPPAAPREWPERLPRPVTPLVGRERELAELVALAGTGHARLLTLVGPGGVGKTRLALELAARLASRYPDGAFFVPLASVADPGAVASTVAQALGLRETGAKPPAELVTGHLRGRSLLLCLDNFEHLLEAVSFVGEIVRAAPSVTVLVTSRALLRLTAEHAFSVPTLAAGEAVELFADRARATHPGLDPGEEAMRVIRSICARLDRLPLAIELAAARSRTLSPQAILARLDERLQLLTGGARDLPARQQTLRAAIDWSHELLEPDEQRLFARLAVFPGGARLDAIETVCDARLDLVESLLAKSLLVARDDPDGEPRFEMLETIREYALEKLSGSCEADEVRGRHACFYGGLVQDAWRAWDDPGQPVLLRRIALDHDNVRAALDSAIARQDAGLALAMGEGIWVFCYEHGHVEEGRRQLGAILSLVGSEPGPDAAWVLLGAGWLARVKSPTEADRLFGRSLEAFREAGDERGLGAALYALAGVLALRGEFERAGNLVEESLDLLRRTGDDRFIALALGTLASLRLRQGRTREAESLLREALPTFERLGDRFGVGMARGSLAECQIRLGNLEQAQTLYRGVISIDREVTLGLDAADALDGLATLAALEGTPDRAALLWGASEAAFEVLGAAHETGLGDERAAAIVSALEALGEQTFDRLRAEGRAMPVEEVVACALADEASRR